MAVIRKEVVVKVGDLKGGSGKHWKKRTEGKRQPSKKSSQSGYKFESEILKSLELLKIKYPTLWYYKMVDTYSYDWIKSVLRELDTIITELNKLSYEIGRAHV
jgi:hypothetical protein